MQDPILDLAPEVGADTLAASAATHLLAEGAAHA